MGLTSESWKKKEESEKTSFLVLENAQLACSSPLSSVPGLLVSSCLVGVDRSHI